VLAPLAIGLNDVLLLSPIGAKELVDAFAEAEAVAAATAGTLTGATVVTPTGATTAACPNARKLKADKSDTGITPCKIFLRIIYPVHRCNGVTHQQIKTKRSLA
jgi:hypothetical protein